MQHQVCLHCGLPVMMIHVHGHYQCPNCGNNALPCCDGDNCSTNQFLATSEKQGDDALSE